MDNFEQPIVSLLNEDLSIGAFLKEGRVDFEIESTIRTDEDDETNSIESFLYFENLKSVINLDVLDGESEDGTPFDKYRRKMFQLDDDGMVLKHVVRQGVGAAAESNSTIHIRYQAYVEYNEVAFDSTLAQGANEDRSVPFNLADGGLLPGLHLALLSMRKGEKAEFLVHPDLAYGEIGCPPRIPPDSTILFIIEVDRFGDKIVGEKFEVPREERNNYSHLHNIASKLNKLGNNLFLENNYTAAAKKYSIIINLLNDAHFANEEEERECGMFIIKIYTNLCVCCYKLKHYKRICLLAADAMKYYQSNACKNPKLLYYWGSAKMMLMDYQGAKKHLFSARRLMPNDPSIKRALADLEQKKRKAFDEEKIMATKAFAFPSKPSPPLVKDEPRDEEFDEDKFWKTIGVKMQELINSTTEDSLVIEDQFSDRELVQCEQLGKDLGLSVCMIDGASGGAIHISKDVLMF